MADLLGYGSLGASEPADDHLSYDHGFETGVRWTLAQVLVSGQVGDALMPVEPSDRLLRRLWASADDLLWLCRRLPLRLSPITRDAIAEEMRFEPLIRAIAAELALIRACRSRPFDSSLDIVRGCLEDHRGQLYPRPRDCLPWEGLGKETKADEQTLVKLGKRATAGDPQAATELLAWRAWIGSSGIDSRYSRIGWLWAKLGIAVPDGNGAALAGELPPTQVEVPSRDDDGRGFEHISEALDASWLALGVRAGYRGSDPSEVFRAYVELATAVIPDMLVSDAVVRAAAFTKRSQLDSALVLTSGTPAINGLKVLKPYIYRSGDDNPRLPVIGPKVTQRVGVLADWFQRRHGVGLNLVHVATDGETFHDIWIRPGSPGGRHGLYRLDKAGGILDYATESYRPGDDHNRRPPDWITGNIVALGGVVPDLRHISNADADEQWGDGFKAAVDRIRAGDAEPTVHAVCSTCGRDIELTFPLRFCFDCGYEMADGAYRTLRQVNVPRRELGDGSQPRATLGHDSARPLLLQRRPR